MRSLAGRTQDSTKEIQEIIIGLQTQSQKAVTAMGTSHARVKNTVEQVSEAGVVFDTITCSVSDIQNMSSEIANSVNQQQGVVNDIDQSIQKIKKIAMDTSTGAEKGVSSSSKLGELASELQSMLEQFKVG